MNKLFKGLVLAALSTGAVCAHHTSHTTIALRSHGYNLPMNYTTFNELINRKADDKFGGNFQVTGFYQASNSEKELGRYFGMNNHHHMLLGHIASGAALTGADLDLAYLIHDSAGTARSEANIKFHPKSESYGAAFAYYQDLEKITKGLFLSVSMPVVHVENDLDMHVSIPSTNATSATTIAQIQNYFNGTLTYGVLGTAADAQATLTKGKIDGKRSETGVADIEVKLGYNFLEKEDYRLGLNVGFTIPTGTENKAYYAFAPVIGNGKHWALGAGLEGYYRVWDKDEQNIKLGMALDYRYLFENTEWRTPGLNNVSTGVAREWGQYHLLGSAVGSTNVTLLTPAANVITQKCDVTPGSQIEGLANVAYNYGGFNFDLGYNMFWREKEHVHSKQTLTASTYGVANRALLATTSAVTVVYGNSYAEDAAVFGNYSGSFDEGYEAAHGATTTKYWISQSDLNFEKAATPSVLTHKIYSGLGYSFKEWDTPLMMGVGGSYEFGNENSAPDFWSVYGKLGVAF